MKVTNVEYEDYDDYVYNFHCTPDENYFSENILVHNCYKRNYQGKKTTNLSFADFKTIINKMPEILTQIAFGITNLETNPEFKDMIRYCRSKGIIPNYTCHGYDTTIEWAEYTAKYCGAVAVSLYDSEKTYNSVKMFTDQGMTQVNIHYMLSDLTGTKEKIDSLFWDLKHDPRLKNLNAVVFLVYKDKRPSSHSQPTLEQYKYIVDKSYSEKVTIGFDSCSAPLFFQANSDMTDKELKHITTYAEPCESGLFSSYINVEGVFFPCSFVEGEKDWATGLDVLSANNFLADIWFHPKTVKFRENTINSSRDCDCKFKDYCRSCTIYNIGCGKK